MMTSSDVPTIETARLRLRPLHEDDIPGWARVIYADPDVVRYLPGPNVTSLERTERLYRHFTDLWPRHGFGGWAVTDRDSGDFLGQAGLNHIADLKETEIDYALAKHAWGRGLATEAASAVARFAFESAGLTRLIGFVIPENVASRRVLERIGFAYECDMHYWGVDLARYGMSPEQLDAATESR
ncbi:MAG TPA: GNAT family N-acetyltransferase [Thermomicrobiales bacterium]|nr:GNAT family N-acetyltransferase [Thermomicrobiales bacterium]